MRRATVCMPIQRPREIAASVSARSLGRAGFRLLDGSVGDVRQRNEEASRPASIRPYAKDLVGPYTQD